MSLSEQLDDVYALVQSEQTIALRAFDVLAAFPEETLTDFLRRDDYARAKRIVEIFAASNAVNVGLLETMIVLAATEQGAELVAANAKVVRKLHSLAAHGDPLTFILPLTQVSRMAPSTLHATLFAEHSNYFTLLESQFLLVFGHF